MNLPRLTIGDVICMRVAKPSFHTLQGKLRSELTYKAPKGKKYVLVLIGVCDDGTEQDVDAEALLADLGWIYQETEGERDMRNESGSDR